MIRPQAPNSDRTAKVVGEIMPFLTSTGDLNEKLRLVGRRLSFATGYDAVSFSLFKPDPDATPSMSTFGQRPRDWSQLGTRNSRDGAKARTRFVN